MYGLDADFLEDLGLGDLLEDVDVTPEKSDNLPLSVKQIDSSSRPPRKSSANRAQNNAEKVNENMTFEEMREKFNSDATNNQNSKYSNKLRGLCAQYNE